MASSKNFFNGLYEILSESQWQSFVSETSTKKTGALAFGHWTTGSGDSQVNVYKIWANNQEYNIVDAAEYEALKVRVQNNDSTISDISTWKNALTLGAEDNKIQITGDDGIKGSVSVLAGKYVGVSTADSTITVALNKDSIVSSSTHTATGDSSLATVGYVKDVQDGALKEAKISTAVDNGIATVTLTAKNGKDVESTTAYTVKGDNYITIAGGGDDSTIAVKISVDDSKEKINATTESSTAIATGFAVKEYVADQISALESALELKGSIESVDDASNKLTTDAASKGDTYVVTTDNAFEYNGEKLENGDLVIVKANSAARADSEIIVVERNLDGAVTAAAGLSAGKVVLGAGAQGVITSNYEIGTDDASTIGDSSLATEKFVEKLSGSLAGHKSEGGVVTIDLTSKDATQRNLGSVVVKGADEGYISVDFNASEGIKLSAVTAEIEGITSSTYGLATALNVSTAIHSAINALDVTDTAISGQVVVAVSETDGKVSPTRLGVKVNGQSFKTVEESEGESKVSVLSATIDGSAILVGGGDSSAYKNKSIAAAIDELSQVVSAGVTGENALNPQEGTAANDDFVAVSVIKQENGTPRIDSSVLIATAIADGSTVYTTATGLATDAYVKDYVAYELAWEVISDDTNTENA